MQKYKVNLTRINALIATAAIVVAAAVPAIISGIANAGIPTPRKITLSTSEAAATDVLYDVAFTTADGGVPIQGIVVEICDSSPIIGDSSCTTPTGFDFNETGLQFSDTIAGGAFAIDAITDTNTLVLTRTDATSIAASTALTLTLGDADLPTGDGVTNPSTGNHTFYARILTFTDNDDDGNGCSNADDNATCYAAATPRTYIDAGGVALSTANQIVITAKVQERLTFCVYDGANCGAGTTGISLGNTNGVLDPSGPYVDKSAKFDISTNALSGATIVLKGDILKSGTFDITSSALSGMGAAAATAYASNLGNEQFGFCAYQSAAGSSNLAFSAPYNNGACNSTSQTSGGASVGGEGTANFGFDRTAAASANGSTVATKPAGTASTATLTFIGNISNTTEAGIYQTDLTYIATGTY
jgi:hypothetical protein